MHLRGCALDAHSVGATGRQNGRLATYRMRRVEELTGRDLGSARDRIELWLALRGRELYCHRHTLRRDT